MGVGDITAVQSADFIADDDGWEKEVAIVAEERFYPNVFFCSMQ